MKILYYLFGFSCLVTAGFWALAFWSGGHSSNPYGGLWEAVMGMYGIGATVIIGIITLIAYFVIN